METKTRDHMPLMHPRNETMAGPIRCIMYKTTTKLRTTISYSAKAQSSTFMTVGARATLLAHPFPPPTKTSTAEQHWALR